MLLHLCCSRAAAALAFVLATSGAATAAGVADLAVDDASSPGQLETEMLLHLCCSRAAAALAFPLATSCAAAAAGAADLAVDDAIAISPISALHEPSPPRAMACSCRASPPVTNPPPGLVTPRPTRQARS